MYEKEEAVKKKSVNARKGSREKGKVPCQQVWKENLRQWSTTQCKGLDFRMI